MSEPPIDPEQPLCGKLRVGYWQHRVTSRLTCVHVSEDDYQQNYGTQFIPLWAYCLAAHVPASWQVTIVDTRNQDPAGCGPADVFALSGINQDVHAIKRLWTALKERFPDATFILGGPITWSFEQQGKLAELDYFDHIFILDGEETLPAFLDGFRAGAAAPKVIRAERFPLDRSRTLPFDLLRGSVGEYYGGVIEVSRGCPFLCEFCDIRVLPRNNRANNKPVAVIIEELDAYRRLGITRIQFVCDNFIGDLGWARALVQAILDWKARAGADLSIFTWLTINVYKHPDLMEMMRRAGFSVLFIGIESVNQHSLLETAKMQNVRVLREAVTAIAGYGFIIAPGFIFGFDSDDVAMFDDTLAFLADAGIIGGDPTFLTAMPGTPLFERMKRAGRLVESEDGARRKLQTNIRYLQDAGFLARGFVRFIAAYTSASFQRARFEKLLTIVRTSGRYVGVSRTGYGSPLPYLQLQLRHRRYLKMLLARIWLLVKRPSWLWAALNGGVLAWRHRRECPDAGAYFFYWLYWWTNIALKYEGLREEDLALHSVGRDFDRTQLAAGQPSLESRRRQARAGVKVEAQLRFTNRALKRLSDAAEAVAPRSS
jgi:radical SAM superfamily enzyme YgiQ (UPF0313 family)